LREKGVYLITGGLGGIGLTVAEELARQCQAKLILTGRSEFPQRADWDEWIIAHGEQESRSQIIRKLQSFEQMGAEILVLSADVSDPEAMLSMAQAAQARFGQIHGVIHAAGISGGGIIQLKQPQLAEAVLKPKVLGTMILHSVLSNQKLDFFLLCSSITSIAGGFGQSDYCAANAFCDAFAHTHFHHRGCYTVAVNWDRWNEIGMAVKAQPSQAPFGVPELNGHRSLPASPDGSHPLLGTMIAQSSERTVYVAEFSPERHWVLSEHKIAGRPIVPGTTYLEMARASFVLQSQGRPISIRQVVFLQPLVVQEGESRFVFTVLEKKDEAYSFRIVSRGVHGNVNEQWQEHARGEIAVADHSDLESRYDMAALLDGLQKAPIHIEDGSYGAAKDKFIVTGPRWDVVKEVYLGANQAVAVLELGVQLAADLDLYQVHPALLDVATGFAHFLTQGDFLPLTYDRILLFGPVPGKAISHLRMHSDLTKTNDILTSDISILDPGGAEVVRIHNFSMKRVTKESLSRLETASVAAVTTASIELRFQLELTPGLSPKEGAEIFRRILTQGRSPQMIVCTREIHDVMRDSASLDRTRVLAELQNLNSQAAMHARPQLSSDFSAPTDEMEQRIAAVWQKVLGVERVGIYDNFFELGGTSLNGIQLAAELKKELNIELPSVTIFESPTVAALAKHLRPGTDQEQFKQVQSRAERKKQALETTQRKRVRVGAGQ
ncbi:MAG TPA: SDR family NAD(P)-dependent oxidoreductase, partial [Candidatus Solibacter sp.]|nr:SDR family NAD(P)-dependent oxidoreductase [Candidatus Solibacter sp.]